MRLVLDRDGRTGTTHAKQAFQSEWATARNGTGRNRGQPLDMEFDPPFPLRGIGEQGFARPLQSGGASVHRSEVTVTTRVRNVLITTEYGDAVQPGEREDGTPMTTPTARSGAERVARDITAALAACSSCGG